MKAMILQKAGGAENLSLQEIDQPLVKEGEVLIKVAAISINPVDIKTRKGGAFYAMMNETGPVILGWDVSGTVVQTGSNVTDFREGDEVFGMVNFPGHGRAYAEYVAAPAAHLAYKPASISHEEAAATTLAALTAWQVLVQQAGLQAGHNVFIHAAAGGVGHFAVQIARHFGATVTGTASASNRDYLLSLGVQQFIDYTTEDFTEGAGNMDIVLDPIGGDTTLRSVALLKKGGNLVSIVGGAKEAVQDAANKNGATAKNYLVQSSGEDMKALAELLSTKSLQPTISHRFPFARLTDSHQQLETGKTRGKVVVVLD